MSNLPRIILKRKIRTFKEQLIDNNGINKKDFMEVVNLFSGHGLVEETFTTVRTKTNYKVVLNIIDRKLAELDNTPVTLVDMSEAISTLKHTISSYIHILIKDFNNCNLEYFMENIKNSEYIYSYNGKDKEILDEPISIIEELPLLDVLTSRKQFISDILITNNYLNVIDTEIKNILETLPTVDAFTLGYLPVLHYLTYKEITFDNVDYDDPVLKRTYTFRDMMILLNNKEHIHQKLSNMLVALDTLWTNCLTDSSLDLENIYEQLIEYTEFISCNKTTNVLHLMSILTKSSD